MNDSQKIKKLMPFPQPKSQTTNHRFPKISIVMPSLKQGIFIEKSILSILNQNYPNLELIIIDGGSTDKTINIIKKYQQYIHYWISEKDKGQSSALNKGFANASGDIFGWLNSDDIYLPGSFNKVSNIFINRPKIKICYGNWYSINKNDEIIEKTYSLPIKKPKSPYEVMNIYNQAVFWKKQVHKKIDENLDRIMDYDLIIRFLLNEKPDSFHKINSFLGAVRRYKEQKTKTDIFQIREEKYLEIKHNFYPKYNFRGIINHLKYRHFQMCQALKLGGIKYTIIKFFKGLKRRKGIL